jgi:cytoskeletal protein CcmA (bactofilin family)
VFVDAATGTQGLETDTGFTYNPSSGNLTIGGQLAAATLDISGDVDVDGTLEADAITVNGTTLAETISDTVGAMVSSNTETGIAVTYDDSDNTLDFVIGSDVIVNSMIADDAIDSAQIADGSIDTAHIADDQVTGAKLSNDVTIANDLTVAGNLVVTGSTTQTGSIVSNSNFQSLANNNSGNATDFGFFGKYVESSTTKYAGLFFDASTDNTFRLFVDTQTEPSTTVNTGATGYAAGTLIAGEVSMTTLDIGGTDVTSTAAELNILDGVTATTAELNYTDGVTSNIQTQLDTKATTGKAIAMALVFG